MQEGNNWVYPMSVVKEYVDKQMDKGVRQIDIDLTNVEAWWT